MTLSTEHIHAWRLGILKSLPFKALQFKSQALPIKMQHRAHNRLTHSLEVAHFSRQLALKTKMCAGDLADEIELAGLIHDIGIPPFGHTGEQSIRDWCQTHCASLASQACNGYVPMLEDFCYFDGNAQGLRMLLKYPFIRKQNIPLSRDVVSAYMKYPQLPAPECKGAGYFYSEQKELASQSTGYHMRQASSYLVEVADDIAHSVGDVEDCIQNNWIQPTHFCRWMLARTQDAGIECIREFCDGIETGDESLALDALSAYLIDKIAEQYVSSYASLSDNIADSFVKNPYIQIIKLIKTYTAKFVFTHPEKIHADVCGYHAIQSWLNDYKRFLQLPRQSVIRLLEGSDYGYIHRQGLDLDYKLASLLPKEWVDSYVLAASHVEDAAEWQLRMHLILDALTLMTNQSFHIDR